MEDEIRVENQTSRYESDMTLTRGHPWEERWKNSEDDNWRAETTGEVTKFAQSFAHRSFAQSPAPCCFGSFG